MHGGEISHDGGGPAAHAQLAENPRQMVLHSELADLEPIPDLLVRKALREQIENLALARADSGAAAGPWPFGMRRGGHPGVVRGIDSDIFLLKNK